MKYDAGFKIQFRTIISVAISEKHVKHLYQEYSSIFQHSKITVFKEICELEKIMQKSLTVKNAIAAAIYFAKT